MKILVVEDDASVAQILKILLTSHGYAVEVAADGQLGLSLAETFEYDLILLDILLPKLDGITLCKQLRAKKYQMPILLLTGQGGSGEKVAGLDTGADDYVVKPFDQEELIARIRALLRRGHISAQPILEWNALRLDPSRREVTYSNHALALTPKEYGLVEMFLRNPRLTFSLGMILEHLWTFEAAPGEDAVRVHIKTLRQKLKAAGAPIDLIETVYGVGYRLNPLRDLAHSSQSASSQSTSEPAAIAPSTPGSPSDFSVALPSANTAPLQSVAAVRIASDPAPTDVLVIATDAQTRSQLKTLLDPEGIQTMLLDHWQTLQQTLAEISPHLLILAIDNSDLSGNGVALCQLIRQDDRWQTLPILLITPPPDADRIQQFFAAGANDFVSQPIAGPELLARVRVHLHRALLQQKVDFLEAQTSSGLPSQPASSDDRPQPFSLSDILRSS